MIFYFAVRLRYKKAEAAISASNLFWLCALNKFFKQDLLFKKSVIRKYFRDYSIG